MSVRARIFWFLYLNHLLLVLDDKLPSISYSFQCFGHILLWQPPKSYNGTHQASRNSRIRISISRSLDDPRHPILIKFIVELAFSSLQLMKNPKSISKSNFRISHIIHPRHRRTPRLGCLWKPWSKIQKLFLLFYLANYFTKGLLLIVLSLDKRSEQLHPAKTSLTNGLIRMSQSYLI